MNQQENFEIFEQLPDHHFRTEIPNFIFELGLEPHHLALYCHLKRIAGDSGSCWRNIKSLCEITGMGEGKLRESIQYLSEGMLQHFSFSLIRVQKRFKPDGSRDSNLIYINPVWSLNGDWFRTDPHIRKKGGGTSPNEGGVVHQKRGGGSPNEEKEQHSEEEHSEETNKQLAEKTPVPVVVCSSDENQKIEMLKHYSLPGDVIQSVLSIPLEQLKNSILAYEEYLASEEKKGTPVLNKIGALRQAIIGNWKPNPKKVSKEILKEQKQNQYNSVREKNYRTATKMFQHCSPYFTKDFQFSVNDSAVSLKSGNGFSALALHDPDFTDVMEYYCDCHLKDKKC